MLATSETALICDLAQTYGLLDYRSVPLPILAALAAGLGEDSRIYKAITGSRAGISTVLSAITADRLGLISWQLSGNGENARPKSLLDTILEEPGEEQENYSTIEEFEAERRKIIEGVS